MLKWMEKANQIMENRKWKREKVTEIKWNVETVERKWGKMEGDVTYKRER